MLMTSFKNSLTLVGRKFSVANYQPKGFNYPELGWAKPYDAAGKWVKPSNFNGNLNMYLDALWDLYDSRATEIEMWIPTALRSDILCCWCPYSRPAQRQLERFGSFVCHTGVLGEFLVDKFAVPIQYDQDRVEHMVGCISSDYEELKK